MHNSPGRQETQSSGFSYPAACARSRDHSSSEKDTFASSCRYAVQPLIAPPTDQTHNRSREFQWNTCSGIRSLADRPRPYKTDAALCQLEGSALSDQHTGKNDSYNIAMASNPRNSAAMLCNGIRPNQIGCCMPACKTARAMSGVAVRERLQISA